MKKDKKNILVYAIIAVFIIILITWFLIKGKSMDANSTLINEIYSYVGNKNLELCDGLINYNAKELGYEDIENSSRICTAYSLLNTEDSTTLKIDRTKKNNTCSVTEDIVFATDNYEDEICTITKIDAKLVNDSYKKIYGKDIESYESFQLDNSTICYYKEDAYYCGLSETYTYTIGAEPHTYRTIKKAISKNDEIIIYDYFIRITNDECYTTYTGDTKNEKCTDNYAGKEIDYKFMRKYGTLYKHTFKKSGDSYYWIKSEPVN